MIKMKLIVSSVSLIVTFGCFVSAINVQSSPASSNEEPQVTFKLTKQSLGRAMEEIVSQTGYSIEMEKQYESRLVSGEFRSIPVSHFFTQALEGISSVIIVNPEQKLIVVKTLESKFTGQLQTKNQYIIPVNDAAMLEQKNSSTNEYYDNYLPEQLGGIHELDNNFPPKVPSNDKHIVDPQTGMPWDQVEQLME